MNNLSQIYIKNSGLFGSDKSSLDSNLSYNSPSAGSFQTALQSNIDSSSASKSNNLSSSKNSFYSSLNSSSSSRTQTSRKQAESTKNSDSNVSDSAADKTDNSSQNSKVNEKPRKKQSAKDKKNDDDSNNQNSDSAVNSDNSQNTTDQTQTAVQTQADDAKTDANTTPDSDNATAAAPVQAEVKPDTQTDDAEIPDPNLQAQTDSQPVIQNLKTDAAQAEDTTQTANTALPADTKKASENTVSTTASTAPADSTVAAAALQTQAADNSKDITKNANFEANLKDNIAKAIKPEAPAAENASLAAQTQNSSSKTDSASSKTDSSGTVLDQTMTPDLKITKISYDTAGGSNNSSGKNLQQNFSQNSDSASNNSDFSVLKNLTDTSKTINLRKDIGSSANTTHTAAADSKTATVANAVNFTVQQTASQQKTAETTISAQALKTSLSTEFEASAASGKNSIHGMDSGSLNLAFTPGPASSPSTMQQFASATQSTAQTAYGLNMPENVLLVQELSGKIQSMLKSDNLQDGNSKSMSLELESGSLGQIQVSLHQNGSKISLSLETNSDSSKDSLMNQRDELAREMRNLGYKDVSVDISNGRENQNSSNRNTGKGNDDLENVTLAGDDKFDMEQALMARG